MEKGRKKTWRCEKKKNASLLGVKKGKKCTPWQNGAKEIEKGGPEVGSCASKRKGI